MEDRYFNPLKYNFKKLLEEFNSLTPEQKDEINEFAEGTAFSFKNAKSFKISEVKKYDVLYLLLPNTAKPHYCVVFNVDKENNKVYCVNITSKNKPFCIHQIKSSRQFKGSFFSSLIAITSIEDAKENFRFVYSDGRDEFNRVVKEIGKMYKTMFNY